MSTTIKPGSNEMMDVDPALAQPHATHFETMLGREREAQELLEAPNWAPWLAFTSEQLHKQAHVFGEGQFLLCEEDSTPLAMLSTNRINWDGDPASLTSWDQIAGDDRTFEKTYDEDGNTLVLLSISIRPDQQGNNLTSRLVQQAKTFAEASGVVHIISDFRPSGYGKYKAEHGDPGFDKYIELKRESDGLPLDPWLRSLARNNMTPIMIDDKAMMAEVGIGDFNFYRTYYNPDKWYRVVDEVVLRTKLDKYYPDAEEGSIEVWECEETGSWYVDGRSGEATYIESNLWGEVPIE